MQKRLLLPVISFLFCCFQIFPFAMQAQKWDTLQPVPEKLTFPVATVLNGKIHLIGGGGASGASKAHYEYNPATNTWATRATLPYQAQQPAGAAVNGKIHHFGGGYPNTGTPLKDHYIYDPVSDTWSPGTQLTAARAIHSSVGLNGQLYSLGGQGVAKLVQVYDTLSKTWIKKNDLPDNNFWYGAHVVTEGKIYRFGGGGYTAPVKSAHEYDPDLDKWTVIPELPNAVHAIKGAAIGHKIFLVGGYYNFAETDEVLVYDIDDQTYSTSTPLPRGRDYHNVVAIDSCIYVIGGNNAIDPTVGVQLLRLCPFNVSATKESGDIRSTLNAWYALDKLRVQLSPQFAGLSFQLTLINTSGQILYSKPVVADDTASLATEPNGLVSGIYFIQVQSGTRIWSGKVFINP